MKSGWTVAVASASQSYSSAAAKQRFRNQPSLTPIRLELQQPDSGASGNLNLAIQEPTELV